ncbi:hypothetical protein CNB00755 [Cryptococcus deneoformans JEC21]|uniref:Uncharacterized protein n=1 Tax=Cryptococcus deneoformans (strain JEC21 / ATCC MYA-565) TaxID=214684 RepID=A0A0S2LIB1_CRYD1|nr:hypothetical protein CNB00755 [Cryptococcus neoformans var. neoformans JEC21]ALO60377.1 hypothetical protein CNB00755 [Cryptococcus neoformans var. neoformans JEC21]
MFSLLSIMWDQPILIDVPLFNQVVEFQASGKLQKVAQSIIARRLLERIIPPLVEHMVDPGSEPFPAEFDIYHSLDHILFRFTIVRRCSTSLSSDHACEKQIWADRLLVEAVACKE